ncbi:hypothetical protein K2X05_01775 [bacterium]|nr:hypothetical protein [bacterium]
MKVFIYFFLYLFSMTVFAQDVQLNSPQKGEVKLSDSVLSALKKWDKDFRVFPIKSFPPTVIGLFRDSKQELPMVVLGDFNGDQKQDVALLGHNKTQQRVVILVVQDKTFVAVDVNTKPFVDPEKAFLETEDTGKEKGLSFYLSLLSAKDLEMSKKSTFKHKPDALQLENYGGQTNAYYLKPKSKNQFELIEYKGMINE